LYSGLNQSPASKQSFESPIKPAQKKETQETDKHLKFKVSMFPEDIIKVEI
jgi:hypothetical protein